MSDVVLVALSGPDSAPALLRAAERLAWMLGSAHITALAFRVPHRFGVVEAHALNVEADAPRRLAREGAERVAAIKSAFDGWAVAVKEAVTSVYWAEAEGDIGVAVGERGSRADFIVVAHPGADDGLARHVFRPALFATARPVLMIPPGWASPFGRKVAIAWRDDKQAARAVIPALRCLGAAERVDVLMGVRDGAARPAMPKVIADHGVSAVLHVLPIGPGPFGRTLLDRAHELGADLLVMGAYAHSPLRELILGGVSRYMLAHADLPVLMRH